MNFLVKGRQTLWLVVVAALLLAGCTAASIVPDVVVHVVDKSGRVLARDYARAIGFPARREGGRTWGYQLEANLDDSTRARVLADMERALSNNVAVKMERLGF